MRVHIIYYFYAHKFQKGNYNTRMARDYNRNVIYAVQIYTSNNHKLLLHNYYRICHQNVVPLRLL